MSNLLHIVPERFTEAREELGLTQVELAEDSGISRFTISKIEKGLLNNPSPETLFSLATSLKKSIDFFCRNLAGIHPTTQISFRSFKSQSNRDNKKARVKILRAAEILKYLFDYIEERYVDIKPLEIDTTRDLLTNEDIEGIAYSVRDNWNLTMGPILDLTTILENHGIICFPGNLPSKTASINVSILLGEEGKESSIVMYNTELNYYRQRFSLAHELGHIILHHYWTKQDFQANDNLAEKQADAFASAFLMPAESFKSSIYGKKISTISALQLKDKWRTSVSSICRRMRDIGYISESEYKNLNIDISRKGWRKCEPKDKTTEPEHPYYVDKAFNFLFSNTVISPKDIVDYMALPAQEIVNYIGNEEWLLPRRYEFDSFTLKN